MGFMLARERVKKRDETDREQRRHVLTWSQRFFFKFFFAKERASREEKFQEKKKQKNIA